MHTHIQLLRLSGLNMEQLAGTPKFAASTHVWHVLVPCMHDMHTSLDTLGQHQSFTMNVHSRV